jgi:hypothetical protein
MVNHLKKYRCFTAQENQKKYFERKLKEAIYLKGGLCLKLLSNHFLGLPDRMCLMPGGIIFFCEIKTTGFERSPRQAWVHKKLIQLGFKSYLIDNMEIINKLTGDGVSI